MMHPLIGDASMFARTSLWVYLGAAILLTVGCAGPDHAAAIRQRFQTVAAHLCKGEVDACVPLVDPLYVRAQGSDAVKFRLGIVATVFKLAKLSPDDVRLDEVKLGADKKTANVIYSLREPGKDVWKQQDPMKWVLSDDVWYWTI